MNELVKQIKERLEKFQDITNSEENLKVHITMWVLEQLGYDRDCMYLEHRLCRKGKIEYADIYVQINEEEGLLIETKKASKTLEEEDVRQLTEYLNTYSIGWGILTNGHQYYLINTSVHIDDIYGNISDILNQVILYVDIGMGKERGRNEKYLKYFSEKSIFEDRVTLFFRDIAQFFVWHPLKESSKEKYRNTLYNFFEYYIETGHKYAMYHGKRHKALEEITTDDMIRFLKAERPFGRPYSGKVPKAKCTHLTTMFRVLEEEGYIRDNRIMDLPERACKEFKVEIDREILHDILTEETITLWLERLIEKEKPNKVMIFVLCFYYGFDRATIVDFFALPWDRIEFDDHRFTLQGKKYYMVSALEKALLEIKENYENKGIKAKAVYVSKKGHRYFPVGKDTVNALFDEDIKKMIDDEQVGNRLNPQNVRASLVVIMFDSGCSIEEISYLTGMSIPQISKYIPKELIWKEGERKWKKGRRKHPFANIFDAKLEKIK